MWWRTNWCMWAFVAVGAAPAHAQCVVALEDASGVVTVDRGDGVPIDIAMQRVAAHVTVPLTDGPLEVRADDVIPMTGTGSAGLLSLAAGTYAGGALDVQEAGLRITRARALAGGRIEVDLPVASDGLLARLVVPCDAMMGSRTTTRARRRARAPDEGSTSSDAPPPEHAARRSQLVLRTDPASDAPPLRITGLRAWDPIRVVEARDRWRRITLPLHGATLNGWVLATALRPLRPPPRRRPGRDPRVVRCGYALGEREHAILARGAPITLPGSERVWAHAESDDSMLVRVRGEYAEILGTSSLGSHTMVRGCPTPIVLGVVSTAFLTRDVVSVLGLRLRREGSGYVLEAHPDATLLRDDLLVGDVLTAVGGIPFDRFVTAHELARTLAAHGRELTLTVVRDGEAIELAPEVHLGYGTWPDVRRASSSGRSTTEEGGVVALAVIQEELAARAGRASDCRGCTTCTNDVRRPTSPRAGTLVNPSEPLRVPEDTHGRWCKRHASKSRRHARSTSDASDPAPPRTPAPSHAPASQRSASINAVWLFSSSALSCVAASCLPGSFLNFAGSYLARSSVYLRSMSAIDAPASSSRRA